MSMLDWLRKGFGYVLLTMGVSRPGTKPRPTTSESGPGSAAPNRNLNSGPQ